MRPTVRAAIATAVVTMVLGSMVGASFYVGYVAGRVGAPVPVLGTLPLPPGLAVARGAANPDEVRAQLGVVMEAWRIVNDEYDDASAIDQRKMSLAAIKGILETLGDSHTTIADPERARQQQDAIRGAFDGIGVSIEIADDRLVVARVLDDSPALAAGVRVGDAVLRVDGQELRSPALDDAIARIRGPRGSQVRLTIARPGEGTLEVAVTRGEIKTAPIRARLLDGRVAYVQLPSFSSSTARDLTDELTRVMEQRPTGLVVDLRNNPGGLLTSAIDVASQFLVDGVVLYEQRRERDPTPFYVRRGGLATELPMVVLVNQGSASAAEIVAGALQDRRRALLVGEPTYGKDSVQNVHQLSDQSSLRVTFARWFTPLRQPIAGKGLTPDILVARSADDRRAGRDPQLDRAVDYLRTRLARAS